MVSILPNTYDGFPTHWLQKNFLSSVYAYSAYGIRSGFFNTDNVMIKNGGTWDNQISSYRDIPSFETYKNDVISTMAMDVDKAEQPLGSTVTNNFFTCGIGKPGATGTDNPIPYKLNYAHSRNIHMFGDRNGPFTNADINTQVFASKVMGAASQTIDGMAYGSIFSDNWVKADGDITTSAPGVKKTYEDECATAVIWDIELTFPMTADEALAKLQAVQGLINELTNTINVDPVTGRVVNQGLQRYFMVPLYVLQSLKRLASYVPKHIPFINSDVLSEFPWSDAGCCLRLSDDTIIVGLDPLDMPNKDISGTDYDVGLYTYKNTFQVGIQGIGSPELFYHNTMRPEDAVSFMRMLESVKTTGKVDSVYPLNNIGLDSVDLKAFEGKTWGEATKYGLESLAGLFGGKALAFPPSLLDMQFEPRPLSNDPLTSKDTIITAQYYYTGVRLNPAAMVPINFKKADFPVVYSSMRATNNSLKTGEVIKEATAATKVVKK